MQSTHLMSNDDVNSMPSSVTELSHPQSTPSVSPVQCQSCLSRPLVYPQHWIALVQLQVKKIFQGAIGTFCKRTEVQDESRVT